MTPERMTSMTSAPARQAPRSLQIRTTSPVAIPRAAASSGLSQTGSRFATLAPRLNAPKSSWLWSPRSGLVRKQMEWIDLAPLQPQPFGGFQPDGMAWAVVVPKGGDGVGKEVDAFRQRLEWIGLR